MREFNDNIKMEIKTQERNPIFEESHETQSLLKNLFSDDFNGELTKDKNQPEVFFDANTELDKLFSDDFFETPDSTDSLKECEKEEFDLNKQYDSNSKYKVDGNIYETDDNGNVYKINNTELVPNNTYTLGNMTYITDEQGRIISGDCDCTLTADGERDINAQKNTGGIDRKEGDQGGHIFARIFGGEKGIENLLAMRGSAINQGVYKRMENEIAKALQDGKDVNIHIDIEYEGDSKRPSKFTVTYTIDGRNTIVQFDNNEGSTDLLNDLKDVIDDDQFDDLNQEIQDANEDGANISIISVKTEYDEDNNITKITVTTRDENSEHPTNEDRVFLF